MFRGESNLSLDGKGRMAVPARYREQLRDSCGGKVIATVSLLDPCLVVYPLPEWQRIEERLKSLPAFDRKAQTIRQLVIGRASDLELDSQGRVLLPQYLREFARLEKRIKMVGQVNNFELWDEETWNRWCTEQLAQVQAGEFLNEQSEALKALIMN